MHYSPYSERIKRNIFDKKLSIKLAIKVIQLILVEKNSKLKLNFENDVISFQHTMTMEKQKNMGSNKINKL